MRMKKTSIVLEKAENRAAAISSIQEDLDLGNDLTLPAYREAIDLLRQVQAKYNAQLSSLDQTYNEFLDVEKNVSEMSELMLSGVKVKFGRDSYEYEMAGGVRQSERKRPKRKPKAEVQP